MSSELKLYKKNQLCILLKIFVSYNWPMFDYQCTSVSFIKLSNRIESNKNLCGRDGRTYDMRPSARAEKYIRDAGP